MVRERDSETFSRLKQNTLNHQWRCQKATTTFIQTFERSTGRWSFPLTRYWASSELKFECWDQKSPRTCCCLLNGCASPPLGQYQISCRVLNVLHSSASVQLNTQNASLTLHTVTPPGHHNTIRFTHGKKWIGKYEDKDKQFTKLFTAQVIGSAA